MQKIAGLAILLLIGLTATTVQAKIATCEISSGGDVLYKGKCNFQFIKNNGSFSIRHPTRHTIVDEVTDISVYITGKSMAQVRGLTVYGNNSMWGDAVRSKKQKACWVGSDFKICAW